jgi:hypothetical protein
MGLSSTFPRLRSDEQPQQSRVQDGIQATLGPVAQALLATPIMGVQPAWTAPTLDKAFGNIGGTFAVAGYYKDSLFRVWSKGVLTTAAGVAGGALVFTFPSGYRPAEVQRKAVEGDAATAQFISISPTGAVTVEVAIGAGGSLDIDFSFLAER